MPTLWLGAERLLRARGGGGGVVDEGGGGGDHDAAQSLKQDR